MSVALQKNELLVAIIEVETDSTLQYFPQQDLCVVYTVCDGELEEKDRIPAWREECMGRTNANTVSACEQMFQDFVHRVKRGSYELFLQDRVEQKLGWVNINTRYDASSDSYFCFVKQMDERVKENRKLFEEARKDPLTKLINKTYSAQLIREAMNRSGSGALFIIDIDNFKSVNDNMGHLFGDEVIVSVANGIKSAFRNQDVVGRIGGDEFIVFVENLSDKEVIKKKAETVCNTIARIYTGENEKVKISASIGISMFPEDAKDYNDLFKMADHALYFTKNRGKNGYTFFDQENEEMRKHHRIMMNPVEETEEVEEINEEMDQFYYELNELAFRLLEETKDATSAINLFLHRIKEEFQFSSIRILELTGEMLELTCSYEIRKDESVSSIGHKYRYDESEWVKLSNMCGGEPLVYTASRGTAAQEKLFRSETHVKSGVIVPIVHNDCFSGVIIFEDSNVERGFTKKEIKVLKSFESMFIVYTGRKLSQEQSEMYLKQMAWRDSMTGLYKYYPFLEQLETFVFQVPEGQKLVYMQTDIAHFKYINESYGYRFGDALLKKFAGEMSNVFSKLLCGCRIHSDNLILVFKVNKELTDEAIFGIVNDQLEEKSHILRKMVPSENLYIHCGIYITHGKDQKYNRAIANASYAKKSAKEKGDGKCEWFDNDMFEKQSRAMQLLDDFPEALKRHSFEVYYQPQIDTISKTVVGAEALSRWNREDGTVLLPNQFIPALENSNRMVELDFYVIESVFEFIVRQRDILDRNIPISVNLSKRHISDPDFFVKLESLMRQYQVDPQYILFEVNEEVFISKMQEAIDFCNHLNMMGIEVMMDCFGAGYSSLNVLDKLPVAYIKIDRLFIKSNAFAKNEEVILNGIVEIAKKLKKATASMGVETFEQNAFLCKCGCDIIQGNYYSEPLHEVDLIQYIREHSEPEVNVAHFTFDGTMSSNNPEYQANVNGVGITFDSHVLEGRKVLSLPGGRAGHEVVELSLGNLLTNDFTVSIWFNTRKANMWTSLFYAVFDEAFFSLMPKSWDGLSVLRVVKHENDEEHFYDAVGTDKEVTGWTHIAGAYNATTHSLALFVNGFLTGYKNEVPTLRNPGRALLGGDVYQNSFEGYVGDLKVINKTMSAKDVRQSYEREKHAYGREF